MPDMHFSQYIAGIYRRSKNETNRQLTALNIRATQSDLMMFIAEHPGRQQQQIAREMSVDASLLARDLTVLTQKGWVTRTPSTTDGRAQGNHPDGDGATCRDPVDYNHDGLVATTDASCRGSGAGT